MTEDLPEEWIDRCKILRPIFNAAKCNDKLKQSTHLSKDKLIIEGHTFTAGLTSNYHEASSLIDLPSTCQQTDQNAGITLFLSSHSPFSNMYHTDFTINNVHYNSVEQYIQSQKVSMFNDDITHAKIMKEDNPYKIKKLGNRVKGFSMERWRRCDSQIAYQAVHAKFHQNETLRATLLSTKDIFLAESSTDPHWGTGVHLHDHNALNNHTWRNNGGVMNNLLHRVCHELTQSFGPVPPTVYMFYFNKLLAQHTPHPLPVPQNQLTSTSYYMDNKDEDPSELLQSENGCEYTDLNDNVLQAMVLPGNTKFNVLHVNIRSFHKNSDSLLMLLKHLKSKGIVIHVIGLCETPTTEASATLKNYQVVSKTRTDKTGGGVSLLVHNKLKLSKMIDLPFNESCEAIGASLLFCNQYIFVSEIYRPPNTSDPLFLESLREIICKSRQYKTRFLCGDFNYNLLKLHLHKYTNNFVSTLIDNEFVPFVSKPTRITHKTSTLIDNIAVNSK